MSITDVAVDRTERIPGEAFNVGTQERNEFEQETPALDLTIKNEGPVNGMVERIELSVEFAGELRGCWGAGAVQYTVAYPMALPQDGRATPYTIEEPVKFQVESGKFDRFAVVFGPREGSEGSWPWLYVVRVNLFDDEGSAIPGGDERVALMAPDMTEELVSWLEGGGYGNEYASDCFADNLDTVREAASTGAVIAPGLATFSREIERATQE